MRRAKGQRHGDAQPTTQFTCRSDGIFCHFQLSTNARRMFAKGDAGFAQSRASGGTHQQLHTEFCFKLEQAPTDDRLRHPKPPRRRRNTPGIGDLDKGLQFFDIQLGVPCCGTQTVDESRYRSGYGNGAVATR